MSMKDNIILRAAEIIEDYQMRRYGMAVYKQSIIPVVKEWYEKGDIVDSHKLAAAVIYFGRYRPIENKVLSIVTHDLFAE